jgi:hypothetical protein
MLRKPLLVLSSKKKKLKPVSQKSEELFLQKPGLEYGNFKPPALKRIFKCLSLLNGLFLGSDDHGFLKDGVKTYLMASN